MAGLVGGAGGAGLVGAASPAAQVVRPTAIVAMGDSYASGEAAGQYLAGTDTDANQCHRSARAFVVVANEQLASPADEVANLACSGSTADDVLSIGRDGEAAQAAQLRGLLATHDIAAVIVSVGGNDLGFSSIIRTCVTAYLPFVDDCNGPLAAALPAQLATVAPRVGAVLDDVQAALDEAASPAPVVLVSYPSPVTDDIRNPWVRSLQGCPFTTADLRWARTGLTADIAVAWSAVAADHGARYLDLSRALEGHEVCARTATAATEWAKGIFVNLAQIRHGLGSNLVSQSLHPNEAGHAKIGRCLARFLPTTDRAAHCLADPADHGDLTPVPVVPAPPNAPPPASTAPAALTEPPVPVPGAPDD